MKTFTSTNDYDQMPTDIADFLKRIFEGEQGMFDYLGGGDVFIVEYIDELSNIVVDYETGGTAEDTVTPMDSVEKLENHTMFFLATNDAGGPSYFVPNILVEHCIILQSIKSATEAPFAD